MSEAATRGEIYNVTYAGWANRRSEGLGRHLRTNCQAFRLERIGLLHVGNA